MVGGDDTIPAQQGNVTPVRAARKHCTSRFHGVHRSGRNKNKPWKGQASHNGKQVSLGYFAIESDAGRAVDVFCKEQGLKAVNFPDTPERYGSIRRHFHIRLLGKFVFYYIETQQKVRMRGH